MSGREPIFKIPSIVLLLLGIFTLIHAAREFLLSQEAEAQLLAAFAFVPARFGFLVDQAAVLARLDQMSQASELDGQIGQFFLTYASPRELWLTPLSYAFLHGDWTHLVFNGVWLAAFGSPVARRLGAARFLLLGAVAAVGGAFFYLLLHLTDFAPMIGASAAISGYMGAAARFVFEPGAVVRAEERAFGAPPMLSIGQMLANRQTLAFVGVWFASNLLFGVGGQSLGATHAPVAWEAHIGGFVAGLLLAPIFDRKA